MKCHRGALCKFGEDNSLDKLLFVCQIHSLFMSLHLTVTPAEELIADAAEVIRTGAGGHAVGQWRQKEQPKEDYAVREESDSWCSEHTR